MAKPLVSVIIPAYNCQKFIGEALDSVLDQDYPHVEVIVIDDGSTDKTPKVLKSYAGRVEVVQQKNAGPAAARNNGLRRARGDLICFLDGDDLWCPGKLSTQVTYMDSHPNAGLVFTSWRVWQADSQGEFSRLETGCQSAAVVDKLTFPHLCGWLYPELLMGCVVHTITAMLRREIVRQVGYFDETRRVGEDYHYWFRVSRICEMHKIKPVMAVYRLHGDNTTATPKAVDHEYQVVQEAVKQWGRSGPDGRTLDEASLNRRLRDLSFAYAYAHYWYGSAAHATEGFTRCLSHDPGFHKVRLYRFLSRFKQLWQHQESSLG